MSEGAVKGEAASAEVPSAAASLTSVPAGGAEGQEASPAWHDGLGLSSDDIQSIESKGWHNIKPADGRTLVSEIIANSVKGYKNAERLRGVPAEQILRLPEPGNEEQQAEFYSRLGVPDSPEGYEPVSIEGVPEDSLAPLATMSHTLKHTPAQHAEFMQQVAGFVEQARAESESALAARLTAEKVELDREWAPALEENMETAKHGIGQLGWDADQISAVEAAIGYKAVMQLAEMVGRITKEPTPGYASERSSGHQAYGMTRESAARRREELAPKAARGDKQAIEELNNLAKMAYHS